jgi:hypothetical protein
MSPLRYRQARASHEQATMRLGNARHGRSQCRAINLGLDTEANVAELANRARSIWRRGKPVHRAGPSPDDGA